MKDEYVFDYLDENDFRIKERNLKKYNMLAYKKLSFEYYHRLRKGEFIGILVNIDKQEKTKSYELKLPTDSMFLKVHGEIKLHYTVYEDKKSILLTNITPELLLSGEQKSELPTYHGVPVRNEKDMFKINLLKMFDKD